MTDPPTPDAISVGVKYCGGCNPLYERSAIVRRLQAEYPNTRAVPLADKDPCQFDFVLVILGCGQSECFDYHPLQGKEGQIVVNCPDDFSKIKRHLDK